MFFERGIRRIGVQAKREPGKDDERPAGPTETRPPGIVFCRFGTGADNWMRRRRSLRHFDLFDGRGLLRLWLAVDGLDFLSADGIVAAHVRPVGHGHGARPSWGGPPALPAMGSLGRLLAINRCECH